MKQYYAWLCCGHDAPIRADKVHPGTVVCAVHGEQGVWALSYDQNRLNRPSQDTKEPR